MSANNPARKVVRTNRLIEELGHDSAVMALLHAQEMQRALQIIYTWSKFPPLETREVMELAKKALRMKND